jgi:hypothetical protein
MFSFGGGTLRAGRSPYAIPLAEFGAGAEVARAEPVEVPALTVVPSTTQGTR